MFASLAFHQLFPVHQIDRIMKKSYILAAVIVAAALAACGKKEEMPAPAPAPAAAVEPVKE
ncbi:MAG: hypothetical protein ABI434_23125, partial [Burkholderiaceae bacterium]